MALQLQHDNGGRQRGAEMHDVGTAAKSGSRECHFFLTPYQRMPMHTAASMERLELLVRVLLGSLLVPELRHGSVLSEPEHDRVLLRQHWVSDRWTQPRGELQDVQPPLLLPAEFPGGCAAL